jgi:hypothetical protein
MAEGTASTNGPSYLERTIPPQGSERRNTTTTSGEGIITGCALPLADGEAAWRLLSSADLKTSSAFVAPRLEQDSSYMAAHDAYRTLLDLSDAMIYNVQSIY